MLRVLFNSQATHQPITNFNIRQRRLGEIRDAFVTFWEELTMTQEIPFIARMIIISDILNDVNSKKTDISYYNTEIDSNSEYCRNTTAWD